MQSDLSSIYTEKAVAGPDVALSKSNKITFDNTGGYWYTVFANHLKHKEG